MSRSFYIENPDTRDYFLSLPPAVQTAIVNAEVYICSLGELQMWAEHYIHFS